MAVVIDPIDIENTLAEDWVPGESWDGRTIAPASTLLGSSVKIMAVTNRDIMIKVKGIMVPASSLTVACTEDLKPLHGDSVPGAYGIPGGDIDINYSIEFGSWLEDGQVDALREALFSGPNGRAVYHGIYVTFLGDPAMDHAGRHPLLTLEGCKAKSDSWVFSQSTPVMSKFDGLAMRYKWYGNI